MMGMTVLALELRVRASLTSRASHLASLPALLTCSDWRSRRNRLGQVWRERLTTGVIHCLGSCPRRLDEDWHKNLLDSASRFPKSEKDARTKEIEWVVLNKKWIAEEGRSRQGRLP